MGDNVIAPVTAPVTVAADEVTDPTLGVVKVQYVKLMDGTPDGTSKALIGADGLATSAVGTVAHDAVDSGKPVKIGYRARASVGTAVAAGDRTDAMGSLTGEAYVQITDSAGAPLDYTAPAQVEGKTAAAAAITAKPVTIGGKGQTALPTAVTDGQVVDAAFDKDGRQVVTRALRELSGWATVAPTNTSAATLIAAGATGIFRDLTDVHASNSSITDTTLTFSDGTASFKIYVPAGTPLVGFTKPFSPRKATTTATAWTVTSSSAVASGLSITADYVERH
jgi:hypothetical protein